MRTGNPVRAEFDTDGDGKVNQCEFYNVQRQVERVEVDRDGDGRMEQRLFYGPGKTLLRAEVDTDGDGQHRGTPFGTANCKEIAATNHDARPGGRHHYRPSGELVFIEVDSTATGKVDQWHRYRDGTLHLVEHDTDGNGAVDRIIHYEGPGQIAQVGKISIRRVNHAHA